jgi:hypothetical protein
MPRIRLAPGVLDDVDRFFDHQAKRGIPDMPRRIGEIISAIQLHAHSPLVGCKAKGGCRTGQRRRKCQRLFMPNTNGLAFSSWLVTSPLSEKMFFSTCSSRSPVPWPKSSLA